MIAASTGILEGFRCLYAGASCSGLVLRAAGSDAQAPGSASLEVMATEADPHLAELPSRDAQMEAPAQAGAGASGTGGVLEAGMHASRSASVQATIHPGGVQVLPSAAAQSGSSSAEPVVGIHGLEMVHTGPQPSTFVVN